ncbi:MAG: 50S ribosomal protein L5 [Deltaproteobacteria bacterium]|nr:50S ribosomal protein L5 [Deltaproteobacteria bacterium]NIS77012.1 50S ribosomal protein L5 [Deltaproteobacteria bacterium]
MKPRLLEYYKLEVKKQMMEQFDYKNEMQVPKLLKVVVNMGVGEAIQNIKILDSSMDEIAVITGQRPIVTKARLSISNFKLRKGMPIGAKVTLRGDRMYFFIDKLFNVALPRVRDFKGVLPRGFDGRGNYTLGIREQIVFPEINYDKIEKIKGMNVTFVTSAKTDEEALALLKLLGMPFRN